MGDTNGYVEAIIDIVRGHSSGATVEEVIAELERRFGAVPRRRIRDSLNQLADDGALVRTRGTARGPGAPPHVYLHAEQVPRQIGLFDRIEGVAESKLWTRTDVEADEQPPEEHEATQTGISVLEQIAEGHLREDRFARAVRDNAVAIAAEDPRELIVRFAQWFADNVNALADEIVRLMKRGRDHNEELRKLEERLNWGRRYFHRYLRLDTAAVDRPPPLYIPPRPRLMILGRPAPGDGQPQQDRAVFDPDRAREILAERVLGDRVIEIMEPPPDRHDAAVGTDASVADVFLQHAQGSFIPPEPVAIMTAAAALINRRAGELHHYSHFDFFPENLRRYTEHRAAEEGLLLSPVLKQILGEGDFKHARSAAMELRQYDEDLRIPLRQAKWHPSASSPVLDYEVRPTLLIRDGRLFPLVHRLKDLEDDGLYGKIVKNELDRFTDVVLNTIMRPTRRMIYAAAVKSPELSWLAPLVFFYLHERGVKVDGTIAIEERHVYRRPFPDTVVSHLLFHGLALSSQAPEEELTDGRMFVTCRAVRRFSDIAIAYDRAPMLLSEGRPVDEGSEADWRRFIHEHRRRREEEGRLTREEGDYENFVYLCANVGVSMCYAMTCAAYEPLVADIGAGQFLLPRLEVAFRAGDAGDAEDNLTELLSWLAVRSGWEADRYHVHSRFDTGNNTNGLFTAVPNVVNAAHEAVTSARDILDVEVQAEMRKLINDLRKRVLGA